MTSTEFKDRYINHETSFNNFKYKTETTISQYIWKPKSGILDYDLERKVIDRAKPFSPVTGVCALGKKLHHFKTRISKPEQE